MCDIGLGLWNWKFGWSISSRLWNDGVLTHAMYAMGYPHICNISDKENMSKPYDLLDISDPDMTSPSTPISSSISSKKEYIHAYIHTYTP